MTDIDFQTLEQTSVQAGGFRIPRFELTIDGVSLDHRVLRDVVDLNYHDHIDQIDGFELTVANWDSSQRRHKYIGSEAPDGPRSELETLFEPCSKVVRLKLGYGGELSEMMSGHFTTMEPTFSSNGPHTLAVRALNVLHRLRRKKYDGHWQQKTDSEIARSFDGLTDPEWRNAGQDARRIPMPVQINSNAQGSEPTLVFVGQKNEYDIDFLWRRARIRGYVIEIRRDEAGHDYLYFGPSERNGPTPYLLRWGAGLIELKATLTTANQVRKVTVRGWDRAAQRPIEESADWDDPRVRQLNPSLSEVVRNCDPREERIVTRPVATRAEAQALARDILLGHAQELVKVQASVVGLPQLRAGSRVRIEGIGGRLSGEYFVTESIHNFSHSGYLTKFTARREDPDSGERLTGA
ncbi:phage late control D family protein [Chitinimonas lacunae]|uniref:Phage late control D family protein n=1 Tax=Chitinimonas lacunae TaxID=1963018 RepID=A0ABV8MNH9_9NEIS